MYSVNGKLTLDMSYDSLSVVKTLIEDALAQDTYNRESNEDPEHYPRPEYEASVRIELENFRNEIYALEQAREALKPKIKKLTLEDLL